MKADIEESRRCTALALSTASGDSILLSASIEDEGIRDNRRRRISPPYGWLFKGILLAPRVRGDLQG